MSGLWIMARTGAAFAMLGAAATIAGPAAARDGAAATGHRKPPRQALSKPAPAAPAASTAPSGTIPMDFSGMSRSVQDVHSDSNARSNSIFNGESNTLRPGAIPSATVKF